MTREEAITALGDRNNLLWGMSKEEQKYYSEALDMAISALQKNERAEEWYKLICKKWDSAEGEYIKKSDVLEELKESGTFYRKRADKYKDTDVERASVAKAVANVYKYLTLFVSGLPAISIHNKAESEDKE